MGARVLVVGCGDIGSRHLQAVSVLSEVSAVEVVDRFPEALERGKGRLCEVEDRQRSTAFRWLTDLNGITADGDLCIVATQAQGRLELVKRIADSSGYRKFLLEKVVTQSARDYEALLDLAEARQLSVWINCKSRTYPFHKRARERLDSSGPIQFSVVSGNHGLATNGIHSVDLFFYYDRSRSILRSWSDIDPVLYPSKRGTELFELSGTVHAHSDRGSHLMLSFAGEHLAPPCYTVSSKNYRFVVDQWDRWAYEAEEGSNWAWRQVPFEGNLLISYMSRKFVKDILLSGHCELPTLAECYPAHAFLLQELQPYFNTLLGKDLGYCPVT